MFDQVTGRNEDENIILRYDEYDEYTIDLVSKRIRWLVYFSLHQSVIISA